MGQHTRRFVKKKLQVMMAFVVVNRGSLPGLDKHESTSDFQRGHAIHHIGPCHWIILCKTPVNVTSMCCLLQPLGELLFQS